jgi:thiosulfate/3-mercaptopyruvate sulfurtransferase|tara:strand:- start:85 stop:912 length:828 start_codon:yes stop_codon:yes gene_type:complete
LNPLVSVSWLSQNLNAPNLVVLDVSLESNIANIKVEFPGIQIKGARYFDLKRNFSDLESRLPNTLPNPKYFSLACRNLGINNNSTIVVYDNIGIYASPRVWWMFKSMGHKNIAVLDGGLPLWKNKNYPTESIQNRVLPEGDFKAKFNPNLLKKAFKIIENITSKEAILVDARSNGRFFGLIPETRKNLKSGHIPNAINLPFLDVLKDGKFISTNEISDIFKKLKIDKRPKIFTCGSGLTACILILASTLISEDNHFLYDGSWSEWGQLKGVPIFK